MKTEIRPWWPGEHRVEKYMPRVSQAIARHLPSGSREATDIYNRAYEAVYEAIKELKRKLDVAVSALENFASFGSLEAEDALKQISD